MRKVSTPESRLAARDRAVVIGKVQTQVQYGLGTAAVVYGFGLLMGVIERIDF
jgi:hypothetical protein